MFYHGKHHLRRTPFWRKPPRRHRRPRFWQAVGMTILVADLLVRG